jgi:phage tail tape-measure protein
MDRQAAEFAKEHRRYLQENLPEVLEEKRRDGTLHSYLSSVGKTAQEMYEHLLAAGNNRPQVQNLPYHQKVSALQNHQQSALEQVQHDLIFSPAPEETA